MKLDPNTLNLSLTTDQATALLNCLNEARKATDMQLGRNAFALIDLLLAAAKEAETVRPSAPANGHASSELSL